MSDSQQYRQHLEILDRDLQKALDSAGRRGLPVKGVLFHAGSETPYHADDQMIAFRATPHFLRWVPLESPDHLVLARPGRKPTVVRVTPKDYWYDTSPPPLSYWEDSVDLIEAESLGAGLEALGPLEGIAYVGSSPAAAAQAGISEDWVEPPTLLAPLDWYRAMKTPHEVAQLRRAAERAAAGHGAAKEAFEDQATEQEIHWAYLRASGQLGPEVPYGTIVALDEKAAILHYQHKRGPEKGAGSLLLLDAGAGHEGQSADITRTWTRDDTDPAMVQLLHGLDALERDLVALVTPGRPYLEIHLQAHRRIGDLLAEVGVIKGSGAAAVERGITGVFMPHGVGHHLGLQVHDVGGRQAGPEGGTVPPPEDHPYLRNTRILEPGHYVTVEPGIYFIPMLLEPLRASSAGRLVDWTLIDRLTPLGGLRIEDNILVTEGEPRDLTRDLIAGPRGV